MTTTMNYQTRMGIVYCGSALEALKELPAASVQCIVTSPPYWKLRDYQAEGQLGLESTYQEFVNNLCDVFSEAWRVLRDDGTAFVVIGDSYTQSKLLIQIPARFSIEMTNRKWILRNSIIWHKPSCLPSPAKDRFTVDYETIQFFSKNLKYKFNQQFDAYTKPLNRWGGEAFKTEGENLWDAGTGQNTYRKRCVRPNPDGRNKRCVWTVNTKPSKIKHFAQYPPELITPCILAGTDEGDVVLDPFLGSGTTALTAVKLNRQFLGIDINEEYCRISAERINNETQQLKLW